MGNGMGCHCSCPCFDKKTVDRDESKEMAGSSEGNSSSVDEKSIDDKPTDVMPPVPPLFPIENEDQIPPHHGPIKQLYANGYNLSIEADGTVKGTTEHYSKWAILEFNAIAPAEARIKGVESQLYLAMNDDGHLYGSSDNESEETVFREMYSNSYLYYLSKKHEDKNWYVGITKSGKPKNGKKTAMGQKATKFLPRQARPPS